MNPRAHILQSLLAALLPWRLPARCRCSPRRRPRPPRPEIQPAISIFVYPNNSSEGRDPFFPDSTRVYASNPENVARGPSLTDLTVKSILGTPPRVFAIINNHTFGAGDEGDVITKTGRRLHIHCVDINPKARHRDRRSQRRERQCCIYSGGP